MAGAGLSLRRKPRLFVFGTNRGFARASLQPRPPDRRSAMPKLLADFATRLRLHLSDSHHQADSKRGIRPVASGPTGRLPQHASHELRVHAWVAGAGLSLRRKPRLIVHGTNRGFARTSGHPTQPRFQAQRADPMPAQDAVLGTRSQNQNKAPAGRPERICVTAAPPGLFCFTDEGRSHKSAGLR